MYHLISLHSLALSLGASTPDLQWALNLSHMQVDDLKCSIKFQLKKVLCMGVAVAHVGMSEREIYINTQVRCLISSGGACCWSVRYSYSNAFNFTTLVYCTSAGTGCVLSGFSLWGIRKGREGVKCNVAVLFRCSS